MKRTTVLVLGLLTACGPPIRLALPPEPAILPADVVVSPISAAAEIISDERMLSLLPGPVTAEEIRRSILIRREEGLGFAEVEIPYQLGERVVGIRGRTLQPDGTVVELERGDVIDAELVRKRGRGAMRLRAKLLVLPRAAPGCVVEYSYQKITPGWQFSGEHVANWRVPVRSARFTLRTARNIDVVTDSRGFVGSGSEHVAVFEAKAIPPWPDEPLAPSPADFGTWVSFVIESFGPFSNAYDSWPEVGRQFWMFATHSADPAPETLVRSRPSGNTLDAIQWLWREVQQNMDDRLPLPGQRPTMNARSLYRSGFGNADERSLVLFSVLSEWGLDPALVLLPTKYSLPPGKGFPTPDRVGDFLVQVRGEEVGTLFLDPYCLGCAAGELSDAHQGQPALLVADRNTTLPGMQTSTSMFPQVKARLIETPVAPYRDVADAIELDLELGERGMIARRGIWNARGSLAAAIRHRFFVHPVTEAEREEFLRRRYLDGAEQGAITVSGLDAESGPVTLRLEDVLWRRGGYVSADRWLAAPLKGLLGPSWLDSLNADRDIPLHFARRPRQIQKIRLAVPDGYRVAQVPNSFTADLPGGRYELAIDQRDGMVLVKETIDLGTDVIELEALPALKNAVEACHQARRKLITFEKYN